MIDSTRIDPELVSKQMMAMANAGQRDYEGNTMVAPALFGPGVNCTPALEQKARMLRFWMRCGMRRAMFPRTFKTLWPKSAH